MPVNKVNLNSVNSYAIILSCKLVLTLLAILLRNFDRCSFMKKCAKIIGNMM